MQCGSLQSFSGCPKQTWWWITESIASKHSLASSITWSWNLRCFLKVSASATLRDKGWTTWLSSAKSSCTNNTFKAQKVQYGTAQAWLDSKRKFFLNTSICHSTCIVLFTQQLLSPGSFSNPFVQPDMTMPDGQPSSARPSVSVSSFPFDWDRRAEGDIRHSTRTGLWKPRGPDPARPISSFWQCRPRHSSGGLKTNALPGSHHCPYSPPRVREQWWLPGKAGSV